MLQAADGHHAWGRNAPLIFLAVTTAIALIVIAVGGAGGALEAEPDSVLPFPKPYTTSTTMTVNVRSSNTDETIRKELKASISAKMRSVLSFYRGEFDKRGWKEATGDTVVKTAEAQLAFVSRDGPGTLKLGFANGTTTVELGQKFPTAAARVGMVPEPGHAKLISESLDGVDVSVSIEGQTIRVARDAGGPQSSTFSIDLPPGKFPYFLEFAEGPERGHPIEIAAGDTWGITTTLSGELVPQHLY